MGGKGLLEVPFLPSSRNQGKTLTWRGVIYETHTGISLSCWFSSLVALQSINQQSQVSFPKHPSIPAPGSLRACSLYLLALANKCPTHTRHASHSQSQTATPRHGWGGGGVGAPFGPKTPRLCLPPRDELNEEEQSFEKGSRDTCSCYCFCLLLISILSKQRDT